MADNDEATKAALVAAGVAPVDEEATTEPPTASFPTAEEALEAEKQALDNDLKAVVDATRETPQMRAKMTRAAFSARNWPDEEHPGTVRDFLEKFNIPVIDSTILRRKAATQISETKLGE